MGTSNILQKKCSKCNIYKDISDNFLCRTDRNNLSEGNR